MDEDFTRYVITLTRKPGVALGEALVREHVTFLQELDARGQLELAGPFEDGAGGMLIVRAASLEEARKLASKDPFVIRGAEDCQVRTWLLSCEENQHMGMGEPRSKP